MVLGARPEPIAETDKLANGARVSFGFVDVWLGRGHDDQMRYRGQGKPASAHAKNSSVPTLRMRNLSAATRNSVS